MSYALNGLGAMPSGPWAEIVVKPSTTDGRSPFTYQLTDDDVLWAARMAQGEGDAPMVLWAMTQRFALLRRTSFKTFIQAYSQPINPIWRRTGSKCVPGGPYYGKADCSEDRLARRDRMATLPWDSITEAARSATLAWAKAELPNPLPGTTDFAAPYLVRKKVERTLSDGRPNPDYDPDVKLTARGSNWFLSVKRAWNWPSDYVTMKLGAQVAGPSVASQVKGAAKTAILVGGPLILAAAGAFAWWAYKDSKKRGSR